MTATMTAAAPTTATRLARRRRRRASTTIARDANTPSTSARVDGLKNEGAYAVLARAAALEARGARVVRLEIGQPGFETPEHVSRAGVEAIESGKTKYAAPNGDARLRDAVAAYLSRTRGVGYDLSLIHI